MKFPQLPPGARFRWQGDVYRKIGPMTARAEAGAGERLIPRSAVVEPVADGATSAQPADHFSPAEVQAALDAYQASLRAYLETMDVPTREALEAHMQAGAQAFRAALRKRAPTADG